MRGEALMKASRKIEGILPKAQIREDHANTGKMKKNPGGSPKLSSGAARNALPKSAFAIPGRRAYPISDEVHARNALSRVAQNGSAAEQARVRAAVKRRYPSIG